jgi:hypothetical protein
MKDNKEEEEEEEESEIGIWRTSTDIKEEVNQKILKIQERSPMAKKISGAREERSETKGNIQSFRREEIPDEKCQVAIIENAGCKHTV